MIDIKISNKIDHINSNIFMIEIYYKEIYKKIFVNEEDYEISERNIEYLYQPSSSLESSIPFPYFTLFNHLNNSNNNSNLKFEASFVGRQNPYIRKFFLKKVSKFLINKNNLFKIRDKYFYSYDKENQFKNSKINLHVNFLKDVYQYKNKEPLYKKLNKGDLYYKSLNNSKICLAPMGNGMMTRRFYEILRSGGIPFLFLPRKTKLPFDWIIDWNELIPIVYKDEIKSNKIELVLTKWLSKELEEINFIRKKCKLIFKKYFNIFDNSYCLIDFILLNEDYRKTLNKKTINFKTI